MENRIDLDYCLLTSGIRAISPQPNDDWLIRIFPRTDAGGLQEHHYRNSPRLLLYGARHARSGSVMMQYAVRRKAGDPLGPWEEVIRSVLRQSTDDTIPFDAPTIVLAHDHSRGFTAPGFDALLCKLGLERYLHADTNPWFGQLWRSKAVALERKLLAGGEHTILLSDLNRRLTNFIINADPTDPASCQSEYDQDQAAISRACEQLPFAARETLVERYYFFSLVVLARLNEEFPWLSLTPVIKLLAGDRWEVCQDAAEYGGDFFIRRQRPVWRS